MKKRSIAATLAGASLLALTAAAMPAAQAQPTGRSPSCFRPDEMSGWRATPDAKALYVRVGASHVYRLDLADRCTALNEGGSHLNLRVHGSPSFCSPVDFDLSVSEGHGFSQPCIVSGMTELSPDEAAALPRDLKP